MNSLIFLLVRLVFRHYEFFCGFRTQFLVVFIQVRVWNRKSVGWAGLGGPFRLGAG